MCPFRLAGDSEDEWFREEMKPVVESLILSGRNILLVTQELPVQPECQRHWEELVATAQQILVDTTKVRLPQSWLAAWSLLESTHGLAVLTGPPGRPLIRNLPKCLPRSSTEFIADLVRSKIEVVTGAGRTPQFPNTLSFFILTHIPF